MSTLSGIGSKGEKQKPKYQSLDINKIYKSTRSDNSEKTQQKSTVPFKHGMQLLGKVQPRRGPVNLPSLKSEHSGSEAAVLLVPPGGSGWVKQDSNATPNGLPAGKTDSQNGTSPSSHQAVLPTQPPPKQEIPHVPSAPIDKSSWSAMISRGDPHSHHPPPYQGPQFHHDFPSLSSAESQNRGPGIAGGANGPELPYSLGLSLRPQTEGSWIGGGSGPGGEGKQTSGHLGAPPQLSAQAGLVQQQQQTLPPQYRGVMPSFMYKNSPPPPSNMSSQAPPLMSSVEHSTRQEKLNYSKKNYEEIVQPSIIKEEELHRMDEIERDMGWAYSDDIDYNKKLSFSDDEMLGEKTSNKPSKRERNSEKRDNKESWQNSKDYSSEEEEIKIKRNQHVKEKELAVQRAKERKKEEEKRFNEATKQGANRKLKELEEKMSKRDRDYEGIGTINPSAVPSKPIAPTEILLPDFQKDKHERSNKEIHEDPNPPEKPSNTFKQLTEIEGKTSFRKNSSKNQDSREQGVPTFSRQFQSNLPPRFKRQHNQNTQMQPDFDPRPLPMSQNYMKNLRKPLFGVGNNDHEIKNQKDDSSTILPTENIRKSESPYDFDKHKKEDKNRELMTDKQEHDYEKIKILPSENKMKSNRSQDNIYDRFQRMDSQESKMSRDSKYLSDASDNREYGSWSESKLDISFEDRRRDGNNRDDRSRPVPGPITRDRIEADDINESRNLTALKKGQMPEKKINEQKNKEEKNTDNVEIQQSDETEMDKSKNLLKKDDKDAKINDNSKKKHDDFRDNQRSTNRNNKSYPQNKSWNNDYHPRENRGVWPKRSNSNKNMRHKSDQLGYTDSEGSSEDHHHSKDDYSHKRERSDRMKGNLKDDKKITSRSDHKERNDKPQDKRDNYVPRGEPSRHGRGGGNFRGRVGLSKRIDGYGPPPSKSPFTHHDDRKESDVGGNNQNSEHDKLEKNINLEDKDGKMKSFKNIPNLKPQNNSSKKPNQTRSTVIDKKSSGFGAKTDSQTKQTKTTDESNVLCNAIADISLKNKEELVEDDDEIPADADGFQEVKSKKTVKDRPKIEEKITPPAFPGKINKPDVNKERDKTKKITQQQPIQQLHNIPPLMATLVNPPQILPQANKNQFDRNRLNKIPPRFAKLRENTRMQKTHQPGHGMVDVNEMKNNVGRNMFGTKITSPTGGNSVMPNAWEKPLAQLRSMETDGILGSGLDNGSNVEHTLQGDVDSEKKLNKPAPLQDSAILDGATPPVTTIIFENTNFKSVRNDKIRKEETILENQTMSMKPINDLLNKNDKQADSIQLQLPFKEDGGDMKLDFFDSDLTLSDEKTLKNPCLTTRSMHSMTTSGGGNNVSTADALNFKIQSAKKLWETPSEHSVPQEDANNSFSSSFVADPSTLDANSFVKGTGDNVDDNHEQHGYQAANQQTSNSTTNVCKVKPTQQVSGASSQAVSNTSGAHPAHSGLMGPGLMGNPLSPPPIQPVIGAGVGIGQPPQQYPTNQHIGYQTSLGSSSQYGMSTIPSPPTVLPYTAQPLQAQTANLYGPFQIDHQAGVLGGQGRSQFSQYPNHYGLGQAASSPYSAQSMFLQTQAHPPPAAQAPELYQNLNNYRLSSGPFGQNQQLNNPTTVLISSTSNSLMSASVKPSSQQISAIGTKSGGVGQAYQQQSQQGQQMYMFDPNIQANYLQGAGVLQRPAGPVQNNVVPTIQPSSSYYSGSTGTAKPCNYTTWRY